MRIGLVRFLNARPLDYGLRQLAAHRTDLMLDEDIPARLAQKLLAGRLDIALISSIEYLRHKNELNMIPGMGVCALKKADSLFYIRSKRHHLASIHGPIKTLYADLGSRSTIALFQILYNNQYPNEAHISLQDPQTIPQLVENGSHDCAGLLIGDAALEFINSQAAQDFYIEDLATWWFRQTELPFVFAVWAYHKNIQISSELFENSLKSGLDHLQEIASAHPQYPHAYQYLSQNLHYYIGTPEQKALKRFEKQAQRYNLLRNDSLPLPLN